MSTRVLTNHAIGRTRRNILIALKAILALAGLAAVAALMLEYGGFKNLPVWLCRGNLQAAEKIIVAIFVLDRLMRVVLAVRRLRYLRENWLDYALILIAAAALFIAPRLKGNVLPAASIYIIITQAYLLIALILRGVSVNLSLTGTGIPPSIMLIGSFLVLILMGSGLLMLPAATVESVHLEYIDSLFTATSATCVTGLIVRNTGADFTPFGQAVILVMIQLGAMGIMIFGTMLALLVGKGLSIRGSSAMGEMLATDRVGDLGRVVKFVVLVTFFFEAIGAVMMYPMFASGGEGVSTAMAVWLSIFHSISSFCNAGFSLFGANMMAGVREGWPEPLRDHWQIHGVMAPLIILGGLGFPVLQDCARWVRHAAAHVVNRLGRRTSGGERRRFRLSLHSKIVLTTSLLLIVLGAAGLLLVESAREQKIETGRHPLVWRGESSDWQKLSGPRRVRAAVFQSVTARTAGFNTVDMQELSDAGKFWICGLMVIGGSPAGTAGGMKTVTFALLVLAAYSMLRRRNDVEAFKRSISSRLLRRVLTLALLYTSLVVMVTVLLCVAMHGHERFINLLFEACSACGTVGLTTGVTPHLNTFGKCVIVGGMFIGRIGPLTLLWALTTSLRHVPYSYPQENVVIG